MCFPAKVAGLRCACRRDVPFQQIKFCIAASDDEPMARAAGDLGTDFASKLLKRAHKPTRSPSHSPPMSHWRLIHPPKALFDPKAVNPLWAIKGLLRRTRSGCRWRLSLERARCNLAFTVPTGTPKIRAASFAVNS